MYKGGYILPAEFQTGYLSGAFLVRELTYIGFTVHPMNIFPKEIKSITNKTHMSKKHGRLSYLTE